MNEFQRDAVQAAATMQVAPGWVARAMTPLFQHWYRQCLQLQTKDGFVPNQEVITSTEMKCNWMALRSSMVKLA